MAGPALDSSLLSLNEDLLLNLLSLLPCNALLAIGSTSRRMRLLAAHCELWAPLCAARWSMPAEWAACAHSWREEPEGGPLGLGFRKLPVPALHALMAGQIVRLSDIRSKPELNGRLGVCVCVAPSMPDRWVVSLVDEGALPLTEETAALLAQVTSSVRPQAMLQGASSEGTSTQSGVTASAPSLRAFDSAPIVLRSQCLSPLCVLGREPAARARWKAEWARRSTLDALVRLEVAHAHAVSFAPLSAARADLVLRRSWARAAEPALLAVRAMGESGWDALRSHLPGEVLGGGHLAGGGSGESALQTRELLLVQQQAEAEAAQPSSRDGDEASAAAAAALPKPRAQQRSAQPAKAAAQIAFAFMRAVNADFQLREWCRLDRLLAAGVPVPLESGALVVAAWDDPLCDVRALVARLDELGARLADAVEPPATVRTVGGSVRTVGSVRPAVGTGSAPSAGAAARASAAAAAAAGGAHAGAVEATPDAAEVARVLEASAAAAPELGARGTARGPASAAGEPEPPPRPLPRVQLLAANHLLFGQLGLNGTEREYYDRRNSLLQYLLLCPDWAHGLPIALAVTYQAVCARAGLRLEAVSLPFHFVLKVPDLPERQQLLIDVHSRGRLMALSDAKALLESRGVAWSDAFVRPCSAQDTWLRMARNLVHVAQRLGHGLGAREPYALLAAWAGASAEQRRARVEADLSLRGQILPDLLADVSRVRGPGQPWMAAAHSGGGHTETSGAARRGEGPGAQGARSWRADVAPSSQAQSLSVTEVLGLWSTDSRSGEYCSALEGTARAEV